MNKQFIRAAQVRASSAVIMSNPLLWSEATSLFRAAVHQDNPLDLLGMSHHYRLVTVGDAELNHEIYGDCAICDGDKRKAQLAINLGDSETEDNKCDF